jgi:hemerythrin-like domain-containing protein
MTIALVAAFSTPSPQRLCRAARRTAEIRAATGRRRRSAEDLMREHGVLNRILLIFEAADHRIRASQPLDPRLLAQSANIIKNFIENYHEKLEENYLFPRFEKAARLTELVATLRTQHAAGRQLTAKVLQLTQSASAAVSNAQRNQADKNALLVAMQQFIRMYRPHEAREDTVLFPELHAIVSPHEYDALGEEFEKKEHELFGKAGFEGVRDEVAQIERQLGIYDLAQFTPR